jgi:hypothetical protein
VRSEKPGTDGEYGADQRGTGQARRRPEDPPQAEALERVGHAGLDGELV